MAPQASLCQTLKLATGIRAHKLLLLLTMLWVLCDDMSIKGLLLRTLVGAMLALVLESPRMLRLDMHMNRALILLCKRAMRALEIAIIRSNILKRHFGGDLAHWATAKFNFFAEAVQP